MTRLNTVELRLDERSLYAYLPVALQGPTNTFDARLVIDTGASDTVLSSSLAVALGYDLKEIRPEVSLVVGGTVKSYPVSIPCLSVDDRAFTNVRTRFSELSWCDGLFGNDWLNRFGLLLILEVPRRTAKLVRRD